MRSIDQIPAIEGGKPVRSLERYLVFGAPAIGEPEIEEVVATRTIVGWGDIVATASDNLTGIASLVFTIDGTPVPAADVAHDAVGASWTFEFEPELMGELIYTIQATATDGAGNSASTSFQVIGVATGKKH